MHSPFQIASKYLRYYITASSGKGHGIHSPFVFEFITKVLNDNFAYDAYQRVEDLRQRLLKESTVLVVEDMGAGSGISKGTERSISSIAKNAVKPAKFGQLLFRMVNYYRPGSILELGTSLGITTAYLSLAGPGATVITLEGAEAIAGVAKKNFDALELKNISIIKGNFDQTLPAVLDSLPTVDFCFIDGNHRREPTERYYHQLLPKTGNDSIVIFDDIHWSTEMEGAWETIKQQEDVKCSIDLFLSGSSYSGKNSTKSNTSASGFDRGCLCCNRLTS